MLSFVCVDEALAFVVDLACVSSSLNFKLDLIEVLGGVNAVANYNRCIVLHLAGLLCQPDSGKYH